MRIKKCAEKIIKTLAFSQNMCYNRKWFVMSFKNLIRRGIP